jgi:hypothetical protein
MYKRFIQNTFFSNQVQVLVPGTGTTRAFHQDGARGAYYIIMYHKKVLKKDIKMFFSIQVPFEYEANPVWFYVVYIAYSFTAFSV